MSNEHLGVGVMVRDRAGTRFYVQQKDAQYRPHPLGYSLFGGASEAGETPAEALARELVEELGDASAPLLAANPIQIGEYRVGPRRFRYCLFEAVVDEDVLDLLARARVLEGERGCVVTRDQLRALPFVWGLEAVVLDYLAARESADREWFVVSQRCQPREKKSLEIVQSPATRADNQNVPGTLHQGLLLVYQEDPWLAFDLLGLRRPVDGLPIDRRGEVERDGPEPLTVRQGYPDLVMVHRHPEDETAGLVITVEAQKQPDQDKRWNIPVYQSLLAKEHRLDTYAVVVSLSRRVSKLIEVWRKGGPPRIDVLLHDVDTIPKSPWLDNPADRPLAAVLVGTLHGYAGDLDAARIGFHTALAMGTRRSRRHAMTVLSALPKHQRDQLIGELPVQEQHDWMDIERRSGTYQFGREEGLEQGLEQGREQGLERGLAQARVALREVILGCLEDRGLAIDEASATAIRECSDLPTLQRWARRAVSVDRVEALFDPT